MHVCDYRVMPRIYFSEPIVKTFAKMVSQTEFYLRKMLLEFGLTLFRRPLLL